MASLTVLRPGMLTTIQDLGRWGRQASGVPVGGPMDAYSHVLANRIVGNLEEAAAVEVTLIGPELQADDDVLCAVAGAEFVLDVDGRRMPMHAPFAVRSGQRLHFGDRISGARATLAVRGGVATARIFGSRATNLPARMGPFGGRALGSLDVLPVGDDIVQRAASLPVPALGMLHGGVRVRVIEGPHAAMFTRTALDVLYSSRFTVTPASNRMGYRLDGPRLAHSDGADILSDATPIGSLQVPAAGLPILLMADRQTTGGYPKIATVITADLPLAGQLAPGDWIEFTPCTRAAAVDALRAQSARLRGTRHG